MSLTAYWGRCSESSLRRGHSEDVSPSNWNEFHQFFWRFFVTILLARMFGIWFLIDFVLYSCVWSRAYVVAKPFCWRSHQWTSGEGWKKCFWLPTPTVPSVKRCLFVRFWRKHMAKPAAFVQWRFFVLLIWSTISSWELSRIEFAQLASERSRNNAQITLWVSLNCFLNHLKLAL